MGRPEVRSDSIASAPGEFMSRMRPASRDSSRNVVIAGMFWVGPGIRTHVPPKVGLDGNVSHGIHLGVIQIQQTETYAKWFAGLRDRVARARIDIRIRRLSLGNAGDAKPVGEGVSELRVDHGPGYRVYFIQRGEVVIVLLAGGDKSTQDKDIRNAKALANDLKEF